MWSIITDGVPVPSPLTPVPTASEHLGLDQGGKIDSVLTHLQVSFSTDHVLVYLSVILYTRIVSVEN